MPLLGRRQKKVARRAPSEGEAESDNEPREDKKKEKKRSRGKEDTPTKKKNKKEHTPTKKKKNESPQRPTKKPVAKKRPVESSSDESVVDDPASRDRPDDDGDHGDDEPNANPRVPPQTSDHCCDPPTVTTRFLYR